MCNSLRGMFSLVSVLCIKASNSFPSCSSLGCCAVDCCAGDARNPRWGTQSLQDTRGIFAVFMCVVFSLTRLFFLVLGLLLQELRDTLRLP